MTFTNTIKVDVGHPWKTAQVYVKQGDKDSRKIRAELMNGAASWTIPVGTVATFRAKKPDDTIVTQDATIGSPNIVEVVLDEQVGAVFGVVRGEIRLVNGGEILNTFLISINVVAAAVTDGDIVSRDVLDEYQALVEQMLAVAGSPLVANAAADMTDKTRVYVYTGSEVGYVTGDWYYWDGAAWMAGGAYNSQGIGDAFIEETADYIRQSSVATESDRTPYLYRPVPNPSAILADEKIIGGTIAYNQLVENGDFSDGTTGWSKGNNTQIPSFTASDNVATFTFNAGSGAYTRNINRTIKEIPANHVVYINAELKQAGDKISMTVGLNNQGQTPNTNCVTATPTTANFEPFRGIIKTTQANDRIVIGTRSTTTGLSVSTDVQNVMVKDLTAMFGSTIADYLFTLDSGTLGAGIAKLREWGFLSKVFSPYNAGSLASVNTSGKRVTGKNLFNEALSTIPYAADNVTAQYQDFTVNSTVRHIPEITLEEGITYTLSMTVHSTVEPFMVNIGCGNGGYTFDIKTVTGMTSGRVSVTFTPTATQLNGRPYLAFRPVRYGSSHTFSYDVSDVQLEINSTATAYRPYGSTTYPTTATDLNGIFKLDANNNLYTDGDVYKADGTITKKWRYVDVGEKTWTRRTSDGTNPIFRSGASDRKYGTNADGIMGLCAKYTFYGNDTLANMANNMPNKYFGFQTTTNYIVVRDDDYTDAATFTTANANNYMIYPLATEGTATADPFTALQIVGKGGTEEWIDSRAVPVPVGHRTVYSIGVPDVPANASNATLKATVSGGKTTLSWS